MICTICTIKLSELLPLNCKSKKQIYKTLRCFPSDLVLFLGGQILGFTFDRMHAHVQLASLGPIFFKFTEIFITLVLTTLTNKKWEVKQNSLVGYCLWCTTR